MYRVSFDTLSVGFDACNSANVQLEAINTILTNDLEISKVISQSLEAEKIAVEKQLKKEVRKRKFNQALLWGVSGVAVGLAVIYLVK
jgi:hypothetical protein